MRTDFHRDWPGLLAVVFLGSLASASLWLCTGHLVYSAPIVALAGGYALLWKLGKR